MSAKPPVDPAAVAHAFSGHDRLQLVDVELVGGSESGFHVAWLAAGGGYGMVSVWAEPDGGVLCENEVMSRAFVARVLARFARETPMDEWPPLLREYGSAEVLVGAAAGAWQ